MKDHTDNNACAPITRSFRRISSSENRFKTVLLCLAVFSASMIISSSSRSGSRQQSSQTTLTQQQLNQLQQMTAGDDVGDANNIKYSIAKSIRGMDINGIPVTVTPYQSTTPYDTASRDRCQIIYLLGVEGSMHHGFSTVFDTLARQQVDPQTNLPYNIHRGGMEGDEHELQAALFGLWGKQNTPQEDPKLVQDVLSKLCPDDGRKHVIVEDSSFPCGHEDDPRTYRVHRDPAWMYSTMDVIANSDTALNHPTNLYKFMDSYAPYADVRFVVLHRPFMETIASHHGWDGGSAGHSNVIRGFLLLLRRFLDSHAVDATSGYKLWTLVCIERVAAKFYNNDETDVQEARRNVLRDLAKFLAWPMEECPTCFDTWRESTKDYTAVLGEDVGVLEEHVKTLDGVWPPVVEAGIVEQSQCHV